MLRPVSSRPFPILALWLLSTSNRTHVSSPISSAVGFPHRPSSCCPSAVGILSSPGSLRVQPSRLAGRGPASPHEKPEYWAMRHGGGKILKLISSVWGPTSHFRVELVRGSTIPGLVAGLQPASHWRAFPGLPQEEDAHARLARCLAPANTRSTRTHSEVTHQVDATLGCYGRPLTGGCRTHGSSWHLCALPPSPGAGSQRQSSPYAAASSPPNPGTPGSARSPACKGE